MGSRFMLCFGILQKNPIHQHGVFFGYVYEFVI